MHEASFSAMKCLVRHLLSPTAQKPMSVLDVGSMIWGEGQTSYRSIFAPFGNATYTGLDVAPGLNVDIVAEDPYKFPLESEFFDLVISGQAFEHIEFPWLTMCEIARVLKPGGSAIVIAPSSGEEHKYPQDCWRFYPDGMRALAKWAGLECTDAVTNWPETRFFMWGDTIGVFYKPGAAQRNPNLSILKPGDLQQLLLKIWIPPSSAQIMSNAVRRVLDRHILWRLKK